MKLVMMWRKSGGNSGDWVKCGERVVGNWKKLEKLDTKNTKLIKTLIPQIEQPDASPCHAKAPAHAAVAWLSRTRR